MKQHTTNYTNTFIEIAEDSPVATAQIPPAKEPKTAAQIEFEMLVDSPYKYTSDDVLFESNGNRRGLSRDEFFSKGQACFRASALTKRYGWGAHFNNEGKMAIYAAESSDYDRFLADENVKRVKAVRSSKK